MRWHFEALKKQPSYPNMPLIDESSDQTLANANLNDELLAEILNYPKLPTLRPDISDYECFPWNDSDDNRQEPLPTSIKMYAAPSPPPSGD